MKKIIFQHPSSKGRQLSQKYLKDPHCDFLLILNQKIYPLHRHVVRQSLYLQPFVEQNAKIHVLDTDYDLLIFEQILGYLYGKKLSMERNETAKKFLQIALFLRIKTLIFSIVQDMKQNYEDYGIFTIMEISSLFELKDLYDICIQELIALDFQQVIIYKYDLLYCSENIFTRVIQEHNLLQKQGLIKGLKNQDLKLIIGDYVRMGHGNLDKKKLFSQGDGRQKNQSCGDIKDQSSSSEQIMSRSLKFSKNNGNQFLFSVKLSKIKSCRSVNDNEVEDSHEKQAKQLCNLNSKMIEKNKLFESQLLEIKSQISEETQSSTIDDIEDLEQKCQELKEIGKSQGIKLQKLKSSIQSLSMKFTQSVDLDQKYFKGQFKKPRANTDCHGRPQKTIKF